MSSFDDLPGPTGTNVFGNDLRLPVGMSPDLVRILELPRRAPVVPGSVTSDALVEMQTQKYARANSRCRCKDIDPNQACVTRLLPVQAWALHELTMCGGILAAFPVGAGKSYINLLAPLALRDCSPALLLIPPTLVEQIIGNYKMLAEHFRVPSIVVHQTATLSFRVVIPGEPTLHVLPYSRLSSPKASDWIEILNPRVIICDEVDALKARTSSRTMRILRYYREHPEARFCGWTGSLTDKSILEFSHLSALALGEGSPVPLDNEVVEEWGRALDASPNPCPPGELVRFCLPGEPVRVAFRRRLAETPGFLVTTSSSVVTGDDAREVGLHISERQAPPIPAIIQQALEKVRDFKRPDTLAGSIDDEELTDALSQAKCAQEISTGAFYRFTFPRHEPERLILEWFAARKAYNKELRLKVMCGEKYLDSPNLCEHAARRAWGDDPPSKDRPDWKCAAWPAWREIMDSVQPKTEAVRLHPFLAEDAARWGLENRGIIWYGMVEFAEWVAELSGLRMHTGGPQAGKLLRDETGERSIIASIKSHGRGRDGLQHIYDHQLVANTPSSARIWQQLIGRLHRRGQKTDVVRTWTYLHTTEIRKSFDQALQRGLFVDEVLGEEQKLLAGWRGDDE